MISKTPQNPRSWILGIQDPGTFWDLDRCLPGSPLQRHRNFCKPSSCAIFSPLRQFCRAACRTVCFWPQKPQPIAKLCGVILHPCGFFAYFVTRMIADPQLTVARYDRQLRLWLRAKSSDCSGSGQKVRAPPVAAPSPHLHLRISASISGG